jgi:hypothetical protein
MKRKEPNLPSQKTNMLVRLVSEKKNRASGWEQGKAEKAEWITQNTMMRKVVIG